MNSHSYQQVISYSNSHRHHQVISCSFGPSGDELKKIIDGTEADMTITNWLYANGRKDSVISYVRRLRGGHVLQGRWKCDFIEKKCNERCSGPISYVEVNSEADNIEALVCFPTICTCTS